MEPFSSLEKYFVGWRGRLGSIHQTGHYSRISVKNKIKIIMSLIHL